MTVLKSGCWVCGLMLVFSAQLSWGQTRVKKPLPSNPSTEPFSDMISPLNQGSTPTVATIERIMQLATRNIAKRYSLNDAQTEETMKLMQREVYRFLRENENDVWPVLRDLLASRLRTPNDPNLMKNLGKSAHPILEKAKKAIYEANEEWRHYLTEEQTKMHDWDLAEMRKTFDTIDQRFSQWAEGERPQNDNLFPQPNLALSPLPPTRPQQGKLPTDNIKIAFDPQHIFEIMVKEFIKEYALRRDQITAARSILEEFKIKADDFHTMNKRAIASIIAEKEDALLRRDIPSLKKAETKRKKLYQPVYTLGDQMKNRLMALLETSQIQRHQALHPSMAPKKQVKKTSDTGARTSSTENSQRG